MTEVARTGRSRSQFQQRFLAYVDVLGFRDLIGRMDREPELFEIIRDSLELVDHHARLLQNYSYRIDDIAQRTNLPLPDRELEMTAFSDCYVLSETSSASLVLATVQALGSKLIEKGILTRGAVVFGPAYHNDRVLFGPAVIEAYELESGVAKNPRILVTEAVREEALYFHQFACRGRLFQQDVDGRWFINVLAPPFSKMEPLSELSREADSRAFLKRVRPSLVTRLRRARGKVEHMSKIMWMVDQFNLVAAQEEIELIRHLDGDRSS